MRANVNGAAVRFRVNETLLSAAEEKARREGMSLSEFLRHALRRELHAQPLPEVPALAGSFAAQQLADVRHAAGGDADAQMRLAQGYMDALNDRPDLAVHSLASAITYARLAVMRGNTSYMIQFAGMLLVQAQVELDQAVAAKQRNDAADAARSSEDGNESMAEALFWLNVAADSGDESASELIQIIADKGVPPEAFALAAYVAVPAKEIA